MASESRRSFLAGVGAAAVAGGVLAPEVQAFEPGADAKRDVIGGSPIAVFSRAVRFGRMVWVSGVVGNIEGSLKLASPGTEAEFKQALDNLKASVEAAGSSLDKVLTCTCFISETSDFDLFNTIYKRYFQKDPPARSTVVVKALVIPGAKLEIDCVTVT